MDPGPALPAALFVLHRVHFLKAGGDLHGPNGTKIYDAATNLKIAEVKQDNTVTTQIKKERESKQLIARKDGFQPTPFLLETKFNANSLWNILFWPGFLVDFGTGQMFQWDNTLVDIELEPADNVQEPAAP